MRGHCDHDGCQLSKQGPGCQLVPCLPPGWLGGAWCRQRQDLPQVPCGKGVLPPRKPTLHGGSSARRLGVVAWREGWTLRQTE